MFGFPILIPAHKYDVCVCGHHRFLHPEEADNVCNYMDPETNIYCACINFSLQSRWIDKECTCPQPGPYGVVHVDIDCPIKVEFEERPKKKAWEV